MATHTNPSTSSPVLLSREKEKESEANFPLHEKRALLVRYSAESTMWSITMLWTTWLKATGNQELKFFWQHTHTPPHRPPCCYRVKKKKKVRPIFRCMKQELCLSVTLRSQPCGQQRCYGCVPRARRETSLEKVTNGNKHTHPPIVPRAVIA